MPNPRVAPPIGWLGRFDAPYQRLRRSGIRHGRATWRWWRQRPLLLAGALVVCLYALKELIDPAVDLTAGNLGVDKWLVFAGLAGAALLFMALSRLLWGLRGRPSDPVAGDPETIRFVHSLSAKEVDAVQREVIDPLFGEVYPNESEILSMYARNPNMGVGLYSESLKQFVAFACAWPLRDSAAKKLIAAGINENELTAADILPAGQNCSANYVIVPVIGALDPGLAIGAWRNLRLREEFRKKLRKLFWADDDREITFIATGYSPEGERACELEGMTTSTRVTIDKVDYPIFTKKLKRTDL